MGEQATDAAREGHWWFKPGSASWAALAFALVAVVFYAPILLGLRTFPDGDFTHHFLPFSLFQRQELAAGRLPLWNPYTYAGHPFLADVQAAVFYPISNAVLAVTLPVTDAAARLYLLEVEAVIQVILAGFFLYLLVRGLTQQPEAGFLAGLCWMLSGYLTGYPPLQLAVLRTAIWVPLILWCLWAATAAPHRWRYWIGAAAATAAAFLGGHAQTFLLVAYAVMAWGVLLLFAHARVERREHTPGRTMRRVFGLIGYALLTLALIAPQLLPGLEFARLSVRSATDYDFLSGGFPLQDTWQLLLPGVLTQFSPLYIGVVGLGLAGAAIVSAFARRDTETGQSAPAQAVSVRMGVLFFAGVSLFGLLASYGENGFLYPVLYRIAPGWNLFRGQERAAYLVTFGLSVLAGYGASGIPAWHRVVRRRYALVYGALAATGVYVFGLFWQLFGRTAIGRTEYLLIACVTLLVAMAFCLIVWSPGWSERRTLWLCLLVIANLMWANVTTNLDAGSPAAKARLAPEMEAVVAAVGAPSPDGGRVYNEYRVYEDYGMRLGVEDVWGSSPLRLARYDALFENFPLDRMWALLGVEHVLTWRKELFGPSALLGEFPQATDTTYLHRLPALHPRAWLVSTVEPVTDEEARARLADHQFDIDTRGLVPAETVSSTVSTAAGAGEASITRHAPNRVRIDAASEQGGMVVVSENWMPGWRVEGARCEGGSCAAAVAGLDGLPVLQARRADLTLIGVVVPPGNVTFDLVYAPASVQIGLWIAAGVLVALVIIFGVRTVARRKARDA